MNTRKRIAVFVGQADESYQSRFIAGFLEGAFAYDMDVCVFAMYRKYQDTTERELGDSNIFSLMEPSMFDGVVILEDTIQTAGAADALEERLHESFRGPVLVVETQSRFFDSIFTDGYTPVTELVEHLIVEHGFKDIAFLTGKKWHKHSQERLKAYRDTMAKHGLPVSEDRVFYGDFWYQSGENCADQILMKRNNLPEAIVCANDGMAIGLCKALTEFGIRIPEDIAVLSYDSTFDGQTSPKSITSSLIPAAEFGKYSAGYINNALHGRTTPPFKAESGLLIGETCGCKNITMPHFDMKRREWDTELSLEGFDSINNMMLEELMAQTELTEYLGSVYSYAYQIKGAESFHLCLCSQWKYMGQSTEIAPKNSGYPENMIYAVKYNRDRKDGLVGLDRAFPVKDILPALTDERDHPAAFFFTPVFFKDLCFGYACVSYGNTPRSYDDVYRRWIGSVSHGFEFLRRSLVIAGMQDRLDKIKKRKFEAAAAYENLSDDEKTEYSMVEKILDENLLSYHFQPIVDTVDGSIYSFEALMRPQAERFISPLAVIKYAGMQGRLIDVEKATFLNVLRIIDSDESIPGSSKVFINSIPGVILSESDLEKVKAYLGKYSDRIVVELTEEAELSDAELDTLKSLLRSMNVEIAVDDYGTGYSNVNNLLRYMPDYVKIDRALLSDIQNKPQKQHFVRELINFCRDNNIKALAEGVETAEELRTVIHLGADLIQGYYTARPAPGFISGIDDRIRSEIRTYRQEYLDGTRKEFYVAGKTNRVMLASLVKEGCTDIIVGQGTMVYRDITFVGTPGIRTDIHMKIESGYSGHITLENVYFTNYKNRPCIELESSVDVTFVAVGENTLMNAGIYVPESSRFTLEGDGNIRMELNSSEYYGIGAPSGERHGELNFNQSGAVEMHGRGVAGVCIGSDLGGVIRINSGLYLLDADGNSTVGVGAFDGNADVKVTNCNMSIEYAAITGVGDGSMNGSADVEVNKCSLKITGDGNDCVGVGTVTGSGCTANIIRSSAVFCINAERLTGIGATEGSTRIFVRDSSVKTTGSGIKAIALGGFNEDTFISIGNSDVKAELRNKVNTALFARDDNVTIDKSRIRIVVNGVEEERSFNVIHERD